MERSKWWGIWRAEFKIIIQKEKKKKDIKQPVEEKS